MREHLRRRHRVPATILVAVVFALVPAASQGRSTQWTEPLHGWVLDGTAFAVASTPDAVYVGGDFSLIGRPTGPWADVDPTGAVRPTPNVVRDSVYQAVPDGSGGWFMVVGNDDSRGVAHVRADGQLDPGWKVHVKGNVDVIA